MIEIKANGPELNIKLQGYADKIAFEAAGVMVHLAAQLHEEDPSLFEAMAEATDILLNHLGEEEAAGETRRHKPSGLFRSTLGRKRQEEGSDDINK